MQETQSTDHPVSEKQCAVAEWFADYIRKPLPPECLESNPAWWKFFMQNLRPIHEDIANEVRCDFGRQVNFDDPISIVGAVKYWVEANRNAETRKEQQIQAARKQLLSGTDPESVADQFRLPLDEVWGLVYRLEAEGHEITTE